MISPKLICRCLLAALAMLMPAGSAAAGADWAGSDPASNFTAFSADACYGAGTSPACISAAVAALQRARSWEGKPRYLLPTDFDSLSPGEQVFVLTNLDRVAYGLAPVPGISGSLSADAQAGVRSDSDPTTTGASFASNWAGGSPNILYAYLAWMYADGPGSSNIDCVPRNMSGCWGHRHDILVNFSPSIGSLMMGVAAGADRHGQLSYAMLIADSVSAHPASARPPDYSYTWAQALADGAGRPGAYRPIPYVTVTVGQIQMQGRYLSLTARVSRGAGTARVTAISGGRTVHFAVSRTGATLRCLALLTQGTWDLRLTVTALPGFSAPPPTTRMVRLS